MEKTILHFSATTPRIYSSFDRYNLKLSKELKQKGWHSVFIFLDRIFNENIRADLENSGADVLILKTNKNKLKIFMDVFLLYKQYRPSVVNVHFTNYLRIMLFVLSCIYNFDYFNTMHSSLNFENAAEYRERKGIIKFILLKAFFKLIIGRSKKFFCVSEAIQNQIKELSGIRTEKIKCLYLGVKDIRLKKSREKLRTLLPEIHFGGQVLIANVGAFEHIKGIETLVRAVFHLKHELGNENFLVFHLGGNRKSNLEGLKYNQYISELCKQLKVDSNIIFLGKKNNIYDLLPHFDIYVHPSHAEGLGLAIVEACSAALPVVASNKGGIPEVVVDQFSGFLVEVDNAKELASKMDVLIRNEKLRNEMGCKSYNIYQDKFSIDQQVSNYMLELGIQG